MRTFRIFICGLILSAITIGGGCEQLDRLAAGTKKVTEQGQVILESPAGDLIPPEVRIALEAAGALAAAIALAYEQWRLNNMTRTTKAIVKGIDVSEAQGNPQAPNVKVNIKTAMKLAGDYDKLNKIVDRLKLS